MPLEIKSRDDLIIVPINILHNPGLSLDAKGAAVVMYSYTDLHCTTLELAQLLGVDEKRAKELIRELQNAGYENIFRLSEETETHDEATERCAANLKNC
ncbi:MAG: hypothetical protein IJO10_05490 [Clostridia bacterium]|nr:hypothetical protein [Clostridia bacterium]